MTDDSITDTERELLQMIEQRRVGPVPIDDDVLARFVHLGLIDDGSEHPRLTERGRALLAG